MSIKLQNLWYFTKEEKCLLKDISTTFKAGSVTALMGPSGAGKTTLMDLVARRKKMGITAGDIFYGDMVASQSPSLVAYVQSSDVHIGEFTVRQNLYYSCRLRLAKHTEEFYNKRIEETAGAVGLTETLDIIVGTDLIKGISGGQAKRLSIATEYLALPMVLCLDEPTTGLDSYTSFQIADLLKGLAKFNSKTVLLTVHQPSMDMLDLWDNLCLLESGRIIYSGPLSQIRDYLKRVGFPLPNPNSNPAEFALEILGIEENAKKLSEAWENIDMDNVDNCNDRAPRDHSLQRETSVEVNEEREKLSTWRCTAILCERHFWYTMRSIHGFAAMMGRNLAGALFFSIIYWKIGEEVKQEGTMIYPRDGYLTPAATNLNALLFLAILFAFVINAVSIPAIFSTSRLYFRETASSLYSPQAYWFSVFSVESTILLSGTMIFALAVTYSVELNGSASLFVVYCLLATGIGYAQAKSCSWLCNNGIQAFVIFSVTIAIQSLFAGYMIVQSSSPKWLSWGFYLSVMYWGTGLVMENELKEYPQGKSFLLPYYDYFDQNTGLIVFCGAWAAFEVLVLFLMWPSRSKLTHLAQSHPLITRFAKKDYKKADTAKDSVFSRFPMSISSREFDDDDTVSGRLLPPSSKRFSLENTISKIESALPIIEDAFYLGGSLSSLNSFVTVFRSKASTNYVEDIGKPANTSMDHLESSHRATLMFRDVSYKVEGNKYLLNNVFGSASPFELVAIMGSSGAGKTTLLNVLSGKVTAGEVGGDILINGVSMRSGGSVENKQFLFSIAYVMQSDAHIPSLTVKETLTYAAMLRLRDPHSSSVAVSTSVSWTTQLLSLQDVEDNIIGSGDNMNISLGQLRRLTIGVELVNKPSLIFLDEPTSGLDSYLASSVVKGLQNLAVQGHTILCTIHQPSSDVFSCFSKLLLLSSGQPIYFGSVQNSLHYFEDKFGIYIPSSSVNPAEFVVDIAAKAATSSLNTSSLTDCNSLTTADLCNGILDNAPSLQPLVAPGYLGGEVDAAALTCQSALTSIKENSITMSVLLRRDLVNLSRRKFWMNICCRMLALGFITGLMFGDIEDGNYLERISLQLGCYVMTTIWLIEVIPSFHDDKVIFHRELSSSATSKFTFWAMQGMPYVLISLISNMCFLAPTYFLAGLRTGALSFLKYYFSLVIASTANIYLCQLTSFVTPNPMLHCIIFPGLSVLLQALFCGFGAVGSEMKPFYKWGLYANPIFFLMNALFVTEFKGNDSAVVTFERAPLGADFDDLAELYGWTFSLEASIAYLALHLVLYKLLAYFTVMHTDFSRS